MKLPVVTKRTLDGASLREWYLARHALYAGMARSTYVSDSFQTDLPMEWMRENSNARLWAKLARQSLVKYAEFSQEGGDA